MRVSRRNNPTDEPSAYNRHEESAHKLPRSKHPTKVCTRCNQEFPLAEFSWTGKDKVYSWCRGCSREYQRAVYRTLEGQMKARARAARVRAKRFKLPFDITATDLLALWDAQRGRCAISGMPLILDQATATAGKQAHRPSVDRIIPERGYLRGNVRLVTTMVNFGINKWGLEDFFAMCAAVERSRKREKPP